MFITCGFWCNCEKEIKRKGAFEVLLYILLSSKTSDLSAKANLHFVQPEFCCRHWANALSGKNVYKVHQD